jgi:hypothetical protein
MLTSDDFDVADLFPTPDQATSKSPRMVPNWWQLSSIGAEAVTAVAVYVGVMHSGLTSAPWPAAAAALTMSTCSSLIWKRNGPRWGAAFSVIFSVGAFFPRFALLTAPALIAVGVVATIVTRALGRANTETNQ